MHSPVSYVAVIRATGISARDFVILSTDRTDLGAALARTKYRRAISSASELARCPLSEQAAN
jgi:hypothetical protein